MKKILISTLVLMLVPFSIWGVKLYNTDKIYIVSFFSNIATYRFSWKRTGNLPHSGPKYFNQKWSFSTTKAIVSSPVINPLGQIIFGSQDDSIYCVSPKGTLVWKYTTGGDVDSTPSIASDGTIYFGSDDTYVYALSGTGNLLWRVKTRGVIRSSPLILKDNTIVVTNYDGYILGIKNGTIKWRHYLSGGWCNASPSYNDSLKQIYVANNRGNIYSFTTSGKLLWNKYLPGYSYNGKVQNGTILIDRNDNIYLSSLVGIFSFTSSGKKRWKLSNVRSQMPLSMTSSGDFVVVDSAGYLTKFDSSGIVLLKKKVSSYGNYSAILVDSKDNFYFGSRDDNFYGLNSKGVELFKFNSGKDIDSSAVLSPSGVLYFGTDTGKLYAIK